jgi:hypothetical protein
MAVLVFLIFDGVANNITYVLVTVNIWKIGEHGKCNKLLKQEFYSLLAKQA